VNLVQPATEYLEGYRDALRRGWSPDNLRGALAAREELEEIERDPQSFLERLTDPEAKGPPVILPDGSRVARLPGFRLWLWDGEFCGSIGFRWQPGTAELPPYCLGHIGYAVVPWKERRGYATRALALLLPLAQSRGLAYVELTTEPDNVASQRVIIANGGVLHARIRSTVHHGSSERLLYRIHL